MSDAARVALSVNGAAHEIRVPPHTTLADALREELSLTGTHLGCEHGVCGACTVLVDGRSVRACLMFAYQAEGAEVTTVEGMGDGAGGLGPIQQAFADHHGQQCGFCTPGMLISTLELLRETPAPDDAAIREALAGNVCRCTGYRDILRSVKAAAEALRAAPEGGA